MVEACMIRAHKICMELAFVFSNGTHFAAFPSSTRLSVHHARFSGLLHCSVVVAHLDTISQDHLKKRNRRL